MGIEPDARFPEPPYSRSMYNAHDSEEFPTIVIGGGQAGLAVGYHLAQRGIPFQILDANQRTGDAWRNRWDSLRLFNPARYAGLPGMRYPGRGDQFPTKDEIADYLSEYARRFRLPVRHGVKVDRLYKKGDRFVVAAGEQRMEAVNVVVAMSNYQLPRKPGFAGAIARDIVQLHSHEYRNPSQLRDGPVLVVGVGNSGAEIAMEAARSHPTWISGKESGHIPWRIDTTIARLLLTRLVRFMGHHVLTVKTPLGRKMRPKLMATATPLVRVKPGDLAKAGIASVPRVTGVKDGLPLLADGRALEVNNIIWCTGYHHGFPWIDLPVFGEGGEPFHEGGIVGKMPGLYFVGLHFLHSMSSATLIGVGRDAERIANVIALRTSFAEAGAARNAATPEPICSSVTRVAED